MSKAVILAWGFAGVGLIDLVWIDASLLPRVVGSRAVSETEVVSAGPIGSATSASTTPSRATTPSPSSTSSPPAAQSPPSATPPTADREVVEVEIDDPAPTAVRFASVGGTSIGPESYEELDAIVAQMQKTHRRVVVEGHADARGSKRVNLEVSKRRAQAVAQALIARGADPKRVQVRWFGERKPAVVGEGDAAWAANRRAEIEWRGNE